MRLFTGLDLPAEVVRNLEAAAGAACARPRASTGARPPTCTSPPSSSASGRRSGWTELKAALAALPPRRAAFPCASARLGFFPNPHSPRVFWCGIEAPGLAELAAETDRATAALGIARETRAFSPHLTLARIKERLGSPAAARGHRRARRRSISAASRRDSFFLYRSQLRPAGSVYTKLAEFPLSKSMIPLAGCWRSPTCSARFRSDTCW